MPEGLIANGITSPDDDNKRTGHRQPVLKSASLVFDNANITCVVLDVSEVGARVRTSSVVLVPERLVIRFRGGMSQSAVRRWTLGTEIGLSFDGAAALVEEPREMAWRLYEKIRPLTIESTLEVLRGVSFFDDIVLQRAAEEAEAGIRRLEKLLSSRARQSQG